MSRVAWLALIALTSAQLGARSAHAQPAVSGESAPPPSTPGPADAAPLPTPADVPGNAPAPASVPPVASAPLAAPPQEASRRWQLSTNPFGWMLGSIGVGVSRGLTQRFALRFDAAYYEPASIVDTWDNVEAVFDDEATEYAQGVEIDLSLQYFIDRLWRGVFYEVGVIGRAIWLERSIYDGDMLTETQSTYYTYGPQALLGYGWLRRSGLAISVAVGAGYSYASNGAQPDDDGLFFNGYFRVGYAFGQ